jgi:hypothetical protein
MEIVKLGLRFFLIFAPMMQMRLIVEWFDEDD